jgi:alkanesulfonate monooxygenase SsuD/methylene tetrahydromethanopterin reductase-like flavin-dependent oxidoreductase (luciferase family)
VADIVERYGDDPSANIPVALTEYIKERKGYDYNEHGRAGNTHADFVPDAVIDRFCLFGAPEAHIARLKELREIGVDQFAVYLQHDSKVSTLEAYGETIIPALSGPLIAKS